MYILSRSSVECMEDAESNTNGLDLGLIPTASTLDSWEDCGPYRRPGPRAGAHLWLPTPPQPVEDRLDRRGLPRTPIRGCREDRSWAPASPLGGGDRRGPGRRWGWRRHRFRSTTAGIMSSSRHARTCSGHPCGRPSGAVEGDARNKSGHDGKACPGPVEGGRSGRPVSNPS